MRARISDRLCRERGLSVVEHPKQKGMTYKEWDARRKGQSWKGTLQETIDRLLSDSSDFDDFLAGMRTEGYEIKVGKNLSFRAMGQERFTRSKTVGAAFTLEALKERIACHDKHPAEKTIRSTTNGQKVNKLVDIKAKRQEGKGAGYKHTANFVRWAKLFNLKEAANTLNFLTELGISDYDELVTRTDEAGEKFDAASARIKQVESRLAELSELRSHIINYSKTRNIYTAYRNAKDKRYILPHIRMRLPCTNRQSRHLTNLAGKGFRRLQKFRPSFPHCWPRKRNCTRNTVKPGRI